MYSRYANTSNEFYLFTCKNIFDFNYSHFTKTYYESDSNILVNNYNKLGFNHNFGLEIFKSVNDKLITGKFIHKQINHWKTSWNQKDPINIVSIDYQNKLIKPKIHLFITNNANKKLSFKKTNLLEK